MRRDRVVVVGSGIGGLSSAVELAARGADVTVLERAATVGGKMRRITIEGRPIDAGPTVLTMKWVFDALFAAAGASFDAAVSLRRLPVISRNVWDGQSHLDLHEDVDATADAIAQFAGAAEAAGYRRFCADTAEMFRIAKEPFLLSDRSTPTLFASREGLATLGKLKALETMWSGLGKYFRDARMRQLFGRYATYVGASPFETTATMMLIAHVEREGCWSVDGGIWSVAKALADLAVRHGATIRCNAHVAEITTDARGVTGVRLANGEPIAADAVVSNADISAFGTGLFGPGARSAVPPVRRGQRSLSGLTMAFLARPEGFRPSRHTVFFGADYRAEFKDLFHRRRLPDAPTVYLCAQDRDTGADASPEDERFLVVINAPATADQRTLPRAEIEECQTRAFALMARCGLTLTVRPDRMVTTTPSAFATMFPASGGALYGKAMHGWAAAMGRPPARTKVPGLYIVGGGAHPGPGVPMVALSGRKAAAAILSDFTSQPRFRPVVIAGGMSTR
ncbi:1-hydroxycarotenoid 3,4-desaturase CrtD [Acuticoccus kandeliae]|uniref:1-hydroxycarotenoid 3,4-desaturase CrtD n=1 Tax=Acuticoccus kandeliae TaxID=2073160 RepID=UPI000D3E0475|nr:1-hydroxycarotenoid 3,4-desaturase CrtD [Acuticoccus kandeliae]